MFQKFKIQNIIQVWTINKNINIMTYHCDRSCVNPTAL
jgi:hypothetical protein